MEVQDPPKNNVEGVPKPPETKTKKRKKTSPKFPSKKIKKEGNNDNKKTEGVETEAKETTEPQGETSKIQKEVEEATAAAMAIWKEADQTPVKKATPPVHPKIPAKRECGARPELATANSVVQSAQRGLLCAQHEEGRARRALSQYARATYEARKNVQNATKILKFLEEL